MKISFDFLQKPLELNETYVSTLCIENPDLFRNTISALLSEEPESNQIIFSENFTPFKYKGNVCFINDIFNLCYSNSVIKKLYDQIEKYCISDLSTETAELKRSLIHFADLIVSSFDYELEYSPNIEILSLFKMLNIKPYSDECSLIENLLNFIIFISNYTNTKCFILLNAHLYFSNDEIELFYKDIINNHIKLLVLENAKFFSKSSFENIIIYDRDMCETVETTEW